MKNLEKMKNFRKNENFEILEKMKNQKNYQTIIFSNFVFWRVPYKEFHIESLANGNLSWHIFG